MKSRLLIIAGGVLLALSLTADLVGIGGRPGFGWKQGIGSLAGVVGLAAGVWMARAVIDGKA